MNKRVFLFFSALVLCAGCQNDRFIESPMVDYSTGFEVELESIVPDSGPETKTYADEQHLVLWHNDDRISVFEKKTYPEEYRYTGRTGTVGGRLLPVSDEGSVTGGDLDYYYAVYPHSEYNGFDNDGHMLLTIPKEQLYDEFSFGRGTNLMVSASEDNSFRFKNVGGYLVFKLYGEGVSVSSIRLTGNNGELLTGDIDVVVSPGVDPVVTMSNARDAEQYDEAILVCDPPVALGATAEDFKEFWFVLPPLTLNGYSIEVTTSDGKVWRKSTDKIKTISRNHYSPVSVMKIDTESLVPAGCIFFADPEVKRICVENWDTDGDGGLSYEEAAVVTDLGMNFLRNTEIVSFAELQYFTGLTGINDFCFSGCSNLSAIVLPDSITSIGKRAFYECRLSSFNIPDGVSLGEDSFSVRIDLLVLPSCIIKGSYVFEGGFSSISFTGPIINQADMLGIIYDNAFCSPEPASLFFGKDFSYYGDGENHSLGLAIGGLNAAGDNTVDTIVVSSENTAYDSRNDCNALIETDTNTLLLGCKTTVIPEDVTSIGNFAFCDGPTTITVPKGVSYIGPNAFLRCFDLNSVKVLAPTPPVITGDSGLSFISTPDIYVPSASIEAYKAAPGWSYYSDRIQAIAE